MQDIAALAGIIGALAVGTISPGPSFVMVARLAVATSRANGLGAALGMGAGGVVFAVAALLGLQAVLLAVPAVYLALKVLGGLYLCYLGFRIYRAAKVSLAIEAPGQSNATSPSRSFWLGFTTQVSNPKTAIVYASVFAAFLPGTYSPSFSAVLLLVVFVIEAGWYAVVATLLSSARPRRTYLSGKVWIDRAAGVVMGGLGFKLVASAHTA
ncbi:LysE family transporter [uncultured Dechloromonas sp.]|uniref:LysE family translocator n=1 Tax=uncultured Dechloromonas sp. TaxID=171719 RepID=UPI0025ECF5D2|nr:LysE family transporter [uncultured Dechloromonas sp.]